MDRKAIDETLADCRAQAGGSGVSLGDLLDRIGKYGFCFAALLLSVPFVQPFSLGPFNTLASLTLMALGWQMSRGRACPALPERARKLHIQGHAWSGVLRLCEKIVVWGRLITRPRLESWVVGDFGERLVGRMICIGGFLIFLPLFNMPLNNTFPALMVIFSCLAWLEKDGVMIIISAGWGIVTVAYFAVVGIAIYVFGSHIGDWLQSWWSSVGL